IMGGGLAFLTKKSFNPANWSNQKQVWEARQKEGIEKRRIAERDAQLRREREEEDLARAVGGEEGGGRKALSFMYDASRVPGLEKRKGGGDGGDDGGGGNGEGWRHRDARGGERRLDGGEGTSLVYERQPGDDDAAAAFREMLARGTTTADELPSLMMTSSQSSMPRDDGTETIAKDVAAVANNEARERGDHRTNLEKAVGRGINAGSGVTLAQQMERFPMLKGAPRVLPKLGGGGGTGDKESSTAEGDVVGLNFKPLGQVLRNVKCVKCGEWGHTMGDRECKLTGWDPFASVVVSASAIAATHPAPPAAAAAAAAATPIDAAMVQAKIGRKGGDGRSSDRKRIKKEKRNPKDERKRHMRDKTGRSRHHKRHTSRRRRDRSPSYSSSSDLSSSYSSSDEDSYYSRDRRSRKHGKGGYRTSRRRSSSGRHRHDESSDDGSININRWHRSRKESGSSDDEHRFSYRRDEEPKKPSASQRMPKRRDETNTIVPTLAYAAGLATVFTALGVSASALGGVFGGNNFGGGGGFSALVLAAVASLVSVLMGLQLLELIRLPLPSLDFRLRRTAMAFEGGGRRRRRGGNGGGNGSLFDENGGLVLGATVVVDGLRADDEDDDAGDGYDAASVLLRTFLLGGTSALVASPCATPVLTSLLAYMASASSTSATSGDVWRGASWMLSYTLGYSTPLLVAGATGGQALANLRRERNHDGGGFSGLSASVGRWVNPLTGGVLIAFGMNGLLLALLGDPSVSALAPIID
ncbi:hypothetical protein ACHAXA_008860, partial [Cyclostephanos tholiformis]